MYKNPLNNGDLSDYNFLKTQMDNGKRIKKYRKTKAQAKIEPTETQKYYQYLTYQQPILDELNYVAERMKTENINKQKEDFEFIENLKEDREKKLKELSKKENDLTSELRNQLFDTPLINTDTTPTINTDMEMMMLNEVNKDLENIFKKDTAVKKIQAAVKGKLAKNAKAKEIAKVEPINEIDKAFKEARNEIEKDTDAIKKLQAAVKGKLARKELDLKKYEEAVKKYSISTDISQLMNKPIIKSLPKPTKQQQDKDLYANIAVDLPIKTDLQKQEKKDFFELTKGEPELSRRGRPKGSKNKK